MLGNDFLTRWEAKDDEERAALVELLTLSDRAAGILAGAYVESRLKAHLQRLLINHKRKNETLHTRMFRPSGPLGSFSAKIDLGFMLGRYSAKAYEDLCILKDIRNDFAHEAFARSFSEASIKDRCNNLSIVDTNIFEVGGEPTPEPTSWVGIAGYTEARKNPKMRYLMTCLFFAQNFGIWARFGQPLIQKDSF